MTGTHRTEFTYDGSDRHVRVVEKESDTVTSDLRYNYHGLSLLEERASNNSTVLRRFYGNGHVDVDVADSGKRYAYTTDHLGSIREVLLLDGTSGNPTTATLVARYDYDLWGKRAVLDGGSAAETMVMHGYTGHVYHSWSGLWLAPYRAYSSELGRWISRDPIGEAGRVNFYVYVNNIPELDTDPLGLIVISTYDPTESWNYSSSQQTTAEWDSFIHNGNSQIGSRPVGDVQDLINSLAESVRDHGLLDGLVINDHASPGWQQIGDDSGTLVQVGGVWRPNNTFKPEEVVAIVAPFLKPGGFIDFNGCNLIGIGHPSDGSGGGLNPAMAERMQNIANNYGVTPRPLVGNMHWHWIIPGRGIDRRTFKPESNSKECSH